MGRMKEYMLEREGDLALAAAYLVSIDRLDECEAHGVIYNGGYWDLEEDFYKQVMNDRNRGINGPIPWAQEMSAREFTDLLVEAYKGHPGDSCGYCDKLMAE